MQDLLGAGARCVCGIGKESCDIDNERFHGAGRMPRERAIDEGWPFIVGLPDLEQLGVAVDDPVVGHAHALKEAPLGDAVVAHGAWRKYFHGEQYLGCRIDRRRPAAVDGRHHENVRFEI